MIAWPSPQLPDVPGTGPAVRLYDTSSGELTTVAPGPTARMYVCGITPYDATHLGHAATYLTFDLVGRALRDAGHRVEYVQNVTDVDDPLLERAARDGLRWQDLASSQVDLFREDMTALAIIAPDHYVGAVEGIPSDVTAIEALLEGEAAYSLSVPADRGEGIDVYLDLAQAPTFGSVSGWDRAAMLAVYAERGGDPDRPGKRDVLDPLMWRGSRTGEPRFDGGSLGAGRPGWHIECSTIALDHLGMGFDIQGGGDDLIFPHHEMSAVQAVALTGQQPFAKTYVHQAMVGLGGEKMSKSKGNLVLVSALRAQGVDPMAIRLALLDHRYRTPWSWTDADLTSAQDRLRAWRTAAATSTAPADTVVASLRERIADDLDSPGALRVLDQWATEAADSADSGSGAEVATAVDALLGVRL